MAAVVQPADRTYATGRRKTAIAKVWIRPGTGRIVINGREPLQYFRRDVLVMAITSPMVVTETLESFDVRAECIGGGTSGQAGAVRLGIARALVKQNNELRRILRPNGFLTRDARAVERKKPGRPKARKRFQYSKR